MVWPVSASSWAGRTAASSAVERAASSTSPDETECIGARVPVQSRTRTSCRVSTWST